MARKRLKLHHYIPDGPEPMFRIVEERKHDNYWEVRIADAMSDVHDRPFFRARIARKGPRHSFREVAVRGAEECEGARGLVQVTRYQDGIPVDFGVFVSTGRYVWQLTPESLGRLRAVRTLVAEGCDLRHAAAIIRLRDGKEAQY